MLWFVFLVGVFGPWGFPSYWSNLKTHKAGAARVTGRLECRVSFLSQFLVVGQQGEDVGGWVGGHPPPGGVWGGGMPPTVGVEGLRQWQLLSHS